MTEDELHDLRQRLAAMRQILRGAKTPATPGGTAELAGLPGRSAAVVVPTVVQSSTAPVAAPVVTPPVALPAAPTRPALSPPPIITRAAVVPHVPPAIVQRAPTVATVVTPWAAGHVAAAPTSPPAAPRMAPPPVVVESSPSPAGGPWGFGRQGATFGKDKPDEGAAEALKRIGKSILEDLSRFKWAQGLKHAFVPPPLFPDRPRPASVPPVLSGPAHVDFPSSVAAAFAPPTTRIPAGQVPRGPRPEVAPVVGIGGDKVDEGEATGETRGQVEGALPPGLTNLFQELVKEIRELTKAFKDMDTGGNDDSPMPTLGKRMPFTTTARPGAAPASQQQGVNYDAIVRQIMRAVR